MATIVLVPGAWLGAWAWERVVPDLERAGHAPVAVTLPGLADRAAELTPATGLLAHVRDLVARAERERWTDALLVGHSYAGAVVGAVARRAPTHFRGQVYVDTMPMDEGRSFLDGFSPADRTKFLGSLVTVRGTRVWPMPDPLGSQAPVDGLSAADLALLRDRGTPHPAFSFEEPLSGATAAGRLPRCHAVSCVGSDSPEAERTAFLAARPDWTYDSLPTGHWPMLSTPHELAAVLDRIARGTAGSGSRTLKTP
ncbi:MAG TPA: alpha/beta hydrolase [Thermoplasmata archaeon]|nr:alpha/beta hydrolase [Thermoplasmata archaeon]